MARLKILYENKQWLEALSQVLEKRSIDYEAEFVDGGCLELEASKTRQVVLNRLSASASTRSHLYTLDTGRLRIEQLEAAGCRLINGSRAIALEASKSLQLMCLAKHGFRVPKTRSVIGSKKQLIEAAESMEFPFIYKYDCGGKGLGVQLIESKKEFDQFIELETWKLAPKKIHLFQSYIRSREPYITRMEFIAGKFHYAIKADTSRGFELCPAEGCSTSQCSLDEAATNSIFSLREAWHHPIIAKLEAMLAKENIDICGIEVIEDKDGNLWVYDINCNTNYSPDVEKNNPHIQPGLERVVDFVQDELAALEERL